jgi:heat shock protein HtpX
MVIVKRIILFLLTNLAVMILIGIVTRLLGVDRFLTAQGLNYGLLLGFAAVIGFGGSFFSLYISKWMAKKAYGIEVITSPRNEGERWLMETVREYSQRAGIAMPEVGIYDSPEANAFATGPSRSNSLVAVSTGLLAQMNRRQVEGVLGHEIAHIANGDMVTMTLLQGVLNTFVVFLSRVVGFAIDQFMRRNDDSEEGIGMGYYLGSIVCEIVFGLFASLIVMAYSRHREFHADAGGARLAGRDAMIGGLQQLQAIHENGGFLDERSKALSAFKISGKSGGMLALFSSHPPLEERIEALQKLKI